MVSSIINPICHDIDSLFQERNSKQIIPTPRSENFLFAKTTPSNKITNYLKLNALTNGLQGSVGFVLPFLLKDQLHLGPIELSIVTTISSAPWLLRPIIAYWSDSLNSRFILENRIPFLYGAHFIQILSLIGFGCSAMVSPHNHIFNLFPQFMQANAPHFHPSFNYLNSFLLLNSHASPITLFFIFCMVLNSLGCAMNIAMVDAIVADLANSYTQFLFHDDTPKNSYLSNLVAQLSLYSTVGALSSSCFTNNIFWNKILHLPSIGMFINTLLSMHPEVFITYCSVLPICSLFGLFYLHFHARHFSISNTSVVTNNTNSFSLTLSPSAKSRLIFVMISSLFAPSLSSALFYYYTNVLHFSLSQFGLLSLSGNIASLLAVVAYQFVPLLSQFETTSVLFYGNLIALPVSLSLLSILHPTTLLINSPTSLIFTRHCLLEFLNAIMFIPLSVSILKVVPVGSEGIFMAIVNTISDSCSFINGIGNSLLMSKFNLNGKNYQNIGQYILYVNMFQLIPISSVNFLMNSKEEQKFEEIEE